MRRYMTIALLAVAAALVWSQRPAKSGLGYFLVQNPKTGKLVKVMSSTTDLIQLHPGTEIVLGATHGMREKAFRLERFVHHVNCFGKRCVLRFDNESETCDGDMAHSYWVVEDVNAGR